VRLQLKDYHLSLRQLPVGFAGCTTNCAGCAYAVTCTDASN
jgi:organic radical activating enzyme